jgi:hypothetical protein
MVEKVLSVVAGILVPVIGLLIRASRRNRLRQRISEYLALSEELSGHDSGAATGFKRLASEAAQVLILREQRWLRRKVDPAAVLTIVFLCVPSGVAIALAWDWDSSWKWPTIVAAGVWAVLWIAVGLTQLFKEAGDDASGQGRSPR